MKKILYLLILVGAVTWPSCNGNGDDGPWYPVPTLAHIPHIYLMYFDAAGNNVTSQVALQGDLAVMDLLLIMEDKDSIVVNQGTHWIMQYLHQENSLNLSVPTHRSDVPADGETGHSILYLNIPSLSAKTDTVELFYHYPQLVIYDKKKLIPKGWVGDYVKQVKIDKVLLNGVKTEFDEHNAICIRTYDNTNIQKP